MKNLTTLRLLIISYLLIATPSTHSRKLNPTAAAGDGSNAWVQTVIRGRESITKLHFYVHDVRAGADATLYGVASASISSNSTTSFGQVNVFDDRVTAGPDISSDEVARAQGTTISADLQIRAVAINMNFHLRSGAYNGSTVTIAGRNQVGDPSRELPVIGGTGVFRYARGYAVTSSYSNDAEADYSVLEYTLYVIHPNKELWMDM